MTYGISNIIRVITLSRTGVVNRKEKHPPSWTQSALDLLVVPHLSHLLDFSVALCCYFFFFPLEDAAVLEPRWIVRVVAFNLAVEFTLYGLWHYLTYVSSHAMALQEAGVKYNKKNQYNPTHPEQVHMFSSVTGHLEREMMYTTLGFLVSSSYQVVMMHLWASGALSTSYSSFWSRPILSIAGLFFITYWREFHFYWVHRLMHPWRISLPLVGDIGAILYRHVHSLHHQSHNPGPWAGLSMHPVEHILYYTCTLIPTLVLPTHPLVFLYCKFHADVAPIGGHDGYDDPAGGSEFHYVHHAKFDCNYGVPLVPFDRLFGTERHLGDKSR